MKKGYIFALLDIGVTNEKIIGKVKCVMACNGGGYGNVILRINN